MSDKKSSVSIVIPHWNNVEILSECLESISATDFDKFEIIVVDNASSDNSASWVKSNYPNIKWVIAHAGSAFNKENLNWATSAAVELPNIWLETSSSGNGLYAVYDAVVNHG